MIEEVDFSEANSLCKFGIIFPSEVSIEDRKQLFQVAIHALKVRMMFANLESDIAAATTDVCERIDRFPLLTYALRQRILH